MQQFKSGDHCVKSCKMILITSLIFSISFAQSLNILSILPHPGKSHHFVFRTLLRELAERGHNVTVISHFPEEEPPRRYHDISISDKNVVVEGFLPVSEGTTSEIIMLINFLAKIGSDNCENMLSNKRVQEIVSSKQHFDVTLVEMFNSDCALAIAHKLGTPVIGLISHFILPWHTQRLGIDSNPAYTRSAFVEGGTKPTLVERIKRTVIDVFARIIFKLSENTENNIIKKYLGEVPSLDELARNVNLTLLYHYLALTGSQIFPSNAIEVGGYHVAKAKPLSGKLKTFIEEAEHGIIYISFGSVVKSSTMSKEKWQAIEEAISVFPQRFVWKWDNVSINIDNKLLTAKWLPQADILAHPKTRAFLSHGGMLSTTEAIHFEVPVVAVPLFGDQPGNSASIEESGLGVNLHIKELTKDTLVNAFNKVLDSKFRSGVKNLTKAWHDRPMSPMDTAVFWTEFVARNSHLKFKAAAVEVPLYQYLYLDILIATLVVTVVPIWVISYLLSSVFEKRTISIKATKRGKKSKSK